MPEDTLLSSSSSSSSSSIDLKQPLVCLIPISLSLSLLALRRLLHPQEAAGGGGHGCPSSRFESKTCTVCLDDILCDEEKFKVLPECGHVFHAECIDRWLKCRRSCPLCQRSVPGHSRNFKERVLAAVLSSFCRWMDRRFNSELTLLFCHNL